MPGVPMTSPVPIVPAVAIWVGCVLALGAQVPQAVLDRDARMAGLAIEAAQRGPAVPIPLTGGTARAVGVVYDQYLLGVVIARAQSAAGKTPDAAAASLTLPERYKDYAMDRAKDDVAIIYREIR